MDPAYRKAREARTKAAKETEKRLAAEAESKKTTGKKKNATGAAKTDTE